MESIGSAIEEANQRRNIRFDGGDILIQKGFVQVPIAILKSNDLSAGAKLCYAMLLSYAWHNDYCFPGQEALAKDTGCSLRSVKSYIKELNQREFISIERRGQGKPNIYTLHIRVQKANK